MNKLQSGLLLLAVAMAPLASARELTPAEALGRLSAGKVSAKSATKAERINPVPAHVARTVSGQAAVYVFSETDNDGFLVLSADDQALPLLGYSDSGSFSADRIPPQLEWWLSEYAAQIEYARQNGTQTAGSQLALSVLGNREPIAPMLKTKWDQVAPYNDQCPLDGTSRTWTGCVATAIAQVMKYFEYPKKGQGQITYSIESLEKKVTMNFAQKEFDWSNMLNTYIDGNYSETQADAVAYLMKACGYAVKMQYSLDASGALALNIRNGLVKYFDYDPNTLYTLRTYYSTLEWNEMIYNNLKNVGPVVYGGGSVMGGGHSFVCDGYDGEGLFHFNWGWSGMSDGYFALEALNPGSLGTGGGGGGGYNFTQDALIGLQPNKGQAVEEQPEFITQEGELTAKLTGSVVQLSIANTSNPAWVNYNPATLYFKFGVMFEPQGDTPGESIYQELPGAAVMLEPGYGVYLGSTAKINLDEVGLSDGTYKMVAGSTVVSRSQIDEPTDGSGWIAVKPSYGMPNYVTVKVADGKYSVADHVLPKLNIKGEFLSPLYYGCLTKVRVTVENPGDIDRVSGFAPVIADEEGILMLGESVFVDIPAHTTVVREWVTDFQQYVQFFDPYLEVPLVFTFFNEENYNFYLDDFRKEVKVLTPPDQPRVNVTGLSLPGAKIDKESNYVVLDPNEIKVAANLSIPSGYFAYNVHACLCEQTAGDQVGILETASMPVFLDDTNRKASFEVTISYPAVTPGKTYYVLLAYVAPGGLVQMTGVLPLKFADKPSGIDEVEAAADITCVTDRADHTVTLTSGAGIASVEAYDITGRRVDRTVALDGTTATLRLGSSGMTIIRVRDNAGRLKTFKVAL
ncbi:MAG: C10 family peptidase [Muribaculaceae bacterium]|nr:C10 family peptidase [Muribaculaceae bacterium]